MASWLVSQLKAAENLLEAVDRTVSSATAATGQQPQGPQLDGQSLAPASGDGHYVRQQAAGPFSPAISGVQAGGSPSHATSSPSARLYGATSSPVSAGRGAGSVTMPPAQYQQPAWKPAPHHGPFSSPVQQQQQQQGQPGTAAGAHGPPQPLVTPTAQPSSAGSYVLRQHGPFSPNPASPQQQQQQSASAPAMAPFAAQTDWAPPASAYSRLAAAGGSGPASQASGGQAAASGPSSASSLPAAFSAGSSGPAVLAVQPAEAATGLQFNAPEQPAFGSIPALSQEEAASSATQDLLATSEAAASVSVVTAVASIAESQPAAPANEGFVNPAPGETGTSADAFAVEPQLAAFAENAAAAGTGITAAAAAAAAGHEPLHEPWQPVPVQATAGSSYGPPPPAAAAAAAAPYSANTQQQQQQQSFSADEEFFSSDAAASHQPNSSTSAKEAQLTRLVETLRKRLDTVKAENQQLEDLLHSAEQRTAAEHSRAQQMAAEVAAVQRAQDDLITSAAANAAAQDARIGRLQQELEASTRQVAALQGALEAIQEQHQQVLSSKDSIEGGALEALRAELAAAESQLDSERKAHVSTKAAATARERDLEEQLGSSSEALAATQRQLEELASRGRELEEQHALAAAEAARLKEQVRLLGEQQSIAQQPDPALQLRLEAEKEALISQLNESQASLLQAMQAQRAAEAQVASLQQEIAHLHSSYQASAAARGPPQLEQQVAELQELLYQKQQQLERLSGEKQGQLMMLERQVTTLKQELGKAHAAAAAANTSGAVRAGHDIIPMDALGEPYQRLARHRKLGGAVQATANFLDTTAASATQLLRQQPLVRLAVFLYLVLIHLYVYFLLARMQRQAVMLLAGQDKSTGIPDPRQPGPHH